MEVAFTGGSSLCEIILYHTKKQQFFCFFLTLFVSGCSGRNENRADESPAEKLESVSERVIILETVPPEPDTKEAVVTEENWEHYFDGINGAAVIYDPAESSYHIYNQEMALTQRSPCSTFKIISSLIALENGMIVPGDSVREWNGEIFWNEDWNRDIGFEDAFRTSCVWYYRKVIDEIGKETMQEELNRLHYGNCDISDWEGKLNTNNHNFWRRFRLFTGNAGQPEAGDAFDGSKQYRNDDLWENRHGKSQWGYRGRMVYRLCRHG